MGIFDALKNISDSFFDGLKEAAVEKQIKKAQEKQVPDPLTEKMKQLEKENEEMDELIKKYSE
jgi:hypothetical protein